MFLPLDSIEGINMAYEKQEKFLKDAELRCLNEYGDEVLSKSVKSNGSTCPAFWDGILCWPPTHAGELSVQACPEYFIGFNEHNNASTRCEANGVWTLSNETKYYWANYTLCSNSTTATFIDPIPVMNNTLVEQYMPIIKNFSRTGYFLSLITLIVAFLIMFFIKKLHCPRNKLHMHLFASFIFRATMFFIKDNLFIDGVGMPSDIIEKNGSVYFLQQPETNNWHCKMVTTLWQYFTTANYSWILMEGLYLHNLILLALFSDNSNSILIYILLGWGLPALVIAAYVGARIKLDDNLCWTTYKFSSIYNIIKIPTMISNILNFILFLNIARVLFLKLRSPINEETRLFRRWARSTLVLVPLFGVHYALFIGMSYATGFVEIIWLFCDQLFASFQGFFVAVLYCFLNGEVKTELTPRIHNIIVSLAMFFHCGEFFRTPQGRPSVCTTLSCSSLYNSSVTQRYQNRRSKWDITQPNGVKPRHASIPVIIITEKSIENCNKCQINEKICPEHATYWNGKDLHHLDSSYCSNGNTQITEITACLGKCDHNSKLDPPQLDLEMITLAPK